MLALLRVGDELLGVRPEFLRLRDGGFDALVLEQARRHVPQQRTTMRAGDSELSTTECFRRHNLSNLDPFINANFLAASTQLADLHPERQAHVLQAVLDLVEGLLAEVLDGEQFFVALADEFPDGPDAGDLQAVRRARTARSSRSAG